MDIKINANLNTNVQPSFQARISPHFEKFMREVINSGYNKLKQNYLLNKKIEDFHRFGYEDYTIDFMEKYKAWGRNYIIYAVSDNDEAQKKIFIDVRPTVGKTVSAIMTMKKRDFVNKMKRGEKVYM